MNADRSHTELVRRRRAVAQAVRRAACAACPELGPIRVTDKETQLSRVVWPAGVCVSDAIWSYHEDLLQSWF